MLNQLLNDNYRLNACKIDRSSFGAGSDTYFITCGEARFVLKFIDNGEMNNPDAEPDLCTFLRSHDIPASEFVLNREGKYISSDGERKFHLQKFVEGKTYGFNEASPDLMSSSAGLLGRIHNELGAYKCLPDGIGEGFFRFMTPDNALSSYKATLVRANELSDTESEKDLLFRIELMARFPRFDIDVSRLTCKNTHGDYNISQLICGKSGINAVIDWTSACVHPVVWEITRSFAYGSPSCAGGEINLEEFICYIKSYLKYSPLNEYDIDMLGKAFFYQISVCDYYNQYYNSSAANRRFFLHQAVFSTKLMRWFDKNLEDFTASLRREFL